LDKHNCVKLPRLQKKKLQGSTNITLWRMGRHSTIPMKAAKGYSVTISHVPSDESVLTNEKEFIAMNSNEQKYLEKQIALARAAFTQGDEEHGKVLLHEARIMLTSCIEVENALAHVFSDFGQVVLAKAYFQRALYKDPHNAEAQICLELVGGLVCRENATGRIVVLYP
jgi:hypothetical protein